MKYLKLVAATAAFALTFIPSFGQTKSFKLGQWIEIQNAILKELNQSYVDSLPLDRIEKVGIEAMLELSLIHISEPTRHALLSRMPSSA